MCIRDRATIKVLGFYDKEVDAYIYRENVFLTVIGWSMGFTECLPQTVRERQLS